MKICQAVIRRPSVVEHTHTHTHTHTSTFFSGCRCTKCSLNGSLSLSLSFPALPLSLSLSLSLSISLSLSLKKKKGVERLSSVNECLRPLSTLAADYRSIATLTSRRARGVNGRCGIPSSHHPHLLSLSLSGSLLIHQSVRRL